MSSDHATPTTNTPVAWRLSPADGADLEYVRRRWNGYFGTDRAGGMDFLTAIHTGDHDGVVLVAEADDRRVGCAVAQAADAEHIAEHALSLSDGVPTEGRAAHLNFACVAPPYRGQGIHRAMVGNRVRALAPSVDRFHAVSWVRDDHHDSVGRFGGTWNIVDYITDYYADDRAYCPDCGRACECHAVVWQLDADDAEDEYGF